MYVPLRGVQTDMLRTTFTPTSVEVKFPITFGAQAENQNVLSRATFDSARLRKGGFDSFTGAWLPMMCSSCALLL